MKKFLAVSRKGRINGKRADIYTLYVMRNNEFVLRCHCTFASMDALLAYMCDTLADDVAGYYDRNGITFAPTGYQTAKDIPDEKVLAELDFVEAM